MSPQPLSVALQGHPSSTSTKLVRSQGIQAPGRPRQLTLSWTGTSPFLHPRPPQPCPGLTASGTATQSLPTPKAQSPETRGLFLTSGHPRRAWAESQIPWMLIRVCCGSCGCWWWCSLTLTGVTPGGFQVYDETERIPGSSGAPLLVTCDHRAGHPRAESSVLVCERKQVTLVQSTATLWVESNAGPLITQFTWPARSPPPPLSNTDAATFSPRRPLAPMKAVLSMRKCPTLPPPPLPREKTTPVSLVRRQWHPTPVLLKSHGQRSLAGCSPWGR